MSGPIETPAPAQGKEIPAGEKVAVAASVEDRQSRKSESVGETDLVLDEAQFTDEEYAKLKRKIDWHLLPLMWFCYGIQQADKTAISTQAIFGLRTDTHLVGQQYSWLTTIFYITYLCFEFPSTVLIQRYRMGLLLSIYMICWGIVVLSIGFANNWAQLMALRALQGLFECTISPGFILIIGTWYKTREHVSRSLVFQSANAGMEVISKLVMYGIGVSLQDQPGKQAWRYISYFLGSLTAVIGILCLFLLGTPSEVRWLNEREKEMARVRVISNNSGHDRTALKGWKWKQAWECLYDPCFYFAGLNAFLCSVPNGGLSAFGGIVISSFGFTNLETILIGIPRSVLSVVIFIIVGVICSKWDNLRLWFMAVSILPPFAGFMGMALLENNPAIRWTKWGCYFITVPFVLAGFLAWSLVPSNVAGRTKRTCTTSCIFLCYCVGNMVGSQIFQDKDAPRYVPGTIGCAVCFGIEFVIILTWRFILVARNKRRDQLIQTDGLTPEERVRRGKEFGEMDYTDFENPYFRYTL